MEVLVVCTPSVEWVLLVGFGLFDQWTGVLGMLRMCTMNQALFFVARRVPQIPNDATHFVLTQRPFHQC